MFQSERRRLQNPRMFLHPLAILLACSTAFAAPLRTKNVIFTSTDDLRGQEVFRGAEKALMTKENGGITPAAPDSTQSLPIEDLAPKPGCLSVAFRFERRFEILYRIKHGIGHGAGAVF